MTDTVYPAWNLLLAPSEQGTPHRIVKSAHGHRLVFAEGGEVLDGTSGLWNVNLGYGNRVIAQAVADALVDASYLPSFRYSHDYSQAAARALIDAAGPEHFAKVLFSTSGSAVNDATMKLARQYAALIKEPQRRLVVGLKESYHGQTFGAMALSGEELGQELYGVDRSLLRHVDPFDPAELEELMHQCGEQVAAMVIEPVMGTGCREIPAEMISAILRLRREHGFILVCDEVASGFGRVGPLFASQEFPEPPDILLTSKGLTNGTCGAAALLAGPHIWAAFEAADTMFVHGSTQAGTPPSCAAITATLGEFDALGALESGRRNAALLETGLRELAERHETVAELSGRGCMRGLHLRAERDRPFWGGHITRLVDTVRRHGALVHPGPSAIELFPALTYTEAEIGELLAAVDAGLTEFEDARRARKSGNRPVAAAATAAG
ncbi:daptide-type RiPP biosynthesis aminotransferase [Catenulispora rubra]|uniref:daptide-type RiPP biosynthesis aminotransferase n=1 Tax=Catenulispora rubra TaxID=280293 RepID=UPI0018927452|nr:daptide-type RiPP biosynthesis aminotransferase [Catenulispora rubra]